MLLTVKKQIEETVEFATPAYYKDYLGSLHYINDSAELITVRQKSFGIWEPTDGRFYAEAIEEVLRRGEPCTKEEFDKAYASVIAKLNIAAGAVHF